MAVSLYLELEVIQLLPTVAGTVVLFTSFTSTSSISITINTPTYKWSNTVSTKHCVLESGLIHAGNIAVEMLGTIHFRCPYLGGVIYGLFSISSYLITSSYEEC